MDNLSCLLCVQDCVAYVSQIRKEFMKSGKAKKPCTKPPPEKVKVAVRNLSFAVYKGEVFGLLGPNGAGKTTALSTMTAEVHPSKGKVRDIMHNVCLLCYSARLCCSAAGPIFTHSSILSTHSEAV